MQEIKDVEIESIDKQIKMFTVEQIAFGTSSSSDDLEEEVGESGEREEESYAEGESGNAEDTFENSPAAEEKKLKQQ